MVTRIDKYNFLENPRIGYDQTHLAFECYWAIRLHFITEHWNSLRDGHAETDWVVRPSLVEIIPVGHLAVLGRLPVTAATHDPYISLVRPYGILAGRIRVDVPVFGKTVPAGLPDVARHVVNSIAVGRIFPGLDGVAQILTKVGDSVGGIHSYGSYGGTPRVGGG